MNIKFAAVMLAATLMLQGAVAVSHADDDTADKVADVFIHTLTLPFRLVTGAATGTYGFVTGGAKEAYDMSADVNDRIVDAGTTPAQLLIWPFTLSVGLIKGGVTGFAEKFPEGYDYWDKWGE